MKCDICNGLRYVEEPAGAPGSGRKRRKPCVCVKLKHLVAYGPELMSSLVKLTSPERIQIAETIDKVVDTLYVTIPVTAREDYVNAIIFYFLIKHQQPSYRIFNVYELIEIFLSNHPNYKCLWDIDFDAIILLEGYNEFVNVRQSDIILQMLDICKRRKVKVLFVSRKLNIETVIKNYFDVNKWKALPFSGCKGNNGSKPDKYLI